MKKKSDLLIHYDEENQQFIVYSVAIEDTAIIRSNSFDGVRQDVAFFKEKTPDEAERILGSVVFAGIDNGSINRINIRNYDVESAARMKEWVAELEIAANQNDPDAQFDLHMVYHSKCLKTRLLSDLQRSEELLFAAAGQGNDAAVKAMENWPLLKEAAERRIK